MDLPPDIRAKVDEIRARPGRREPNRMRLPTARVTRDDTDRLSPREAAVVELAAEGFTNPVIADKLLISEETVKSHMRHAIMRTESRNRTHLAVRLARGELRVGLD